MALFFKRLLSFFLALGGWAIAAVRSTLDLIGWSTAPDDIGVAVSALDIFFRWLLTVPWYVPWTFALLSTSWLMWISWPRQPALIPKSHEKMPSKIIEHGTVKGKITIDLLEGEYHRITSIGNLEVAFTGFPERGFYSETIVEIFAAGQHTLMFPPEANVLYPQEQNGHGSNARNFYRVITSDKGRNILISYLLSPPSPDEDVSVNYLIE
ncbi:hypothetical protein MWU54_06150 [Marivita sp. S6314]|uniref:hypothetical protein n=1 Tax=Marivita sp. S6314 TaxID=2926406 RepID=UPI001FF30FA5|nr:hypothetical protein [Marivita sp. S6314]MCK0149595.1 hypothetical protein [Marivita sp. S6314]